MKMPSEVTQARTRIKDLITKLCDGVLLPEEGSRQLIELSKTWSKAVGSDKLVRDSFESVMHFSSDADIRKRDSQYARRQLEGLRRALDALSKAIDV